MIERLSAALGRMLPSLQMGLGVVCELLSVSFSLLGNGRKQYGMNPSPTVSATPKSTAAASVAVGAFGPDYDDQAGRNGYR